ncbi:Hypothetical protein FKW44_021489 [Caligus rogercresseyi]|uniref:Uncharacterized protein n=1 Tax=Caligus rogercresseyi TaxID=217165 RepID=A0A7T8JW64_CALRO|nr:Hypothetical protein FKW44_021489 [Caligus rogercresseyi]
MESISSALVANAGQIQATLAGQNSIQQQVQQQQQQTAQVQQVQTATSPSPAGPAITSIPINDCN